MDNPTYVAIQFNIHKDTMAYFKKLRLNYATLSEKYTFSLNATFTTAILFIYDQFDKDDILLKCNKKFKKAMLKPGRRKANDRTYTNDKIESIVLRITQENADKYMDIMYSFIKNNPNDSLFNEHHSRNYFFYDFLDLIKKKETEFLEFRP